MRQPFTLSVGIMSNSAFASSALSKPPFQISPHRQMQIPAVREMQMGMKYDIVGVNEEAWLIWIVGERNINDKSIFAHLDTVREAAKKHDFF